jgi:polyhydroxyalkanoate synthesis regulator phasin
MGIIDQAASTGAEEAPVEGGEAAPSDEEVVEALGEMVESGEISEEEAMALLEESAA